MKDETKTAPDAYRLARKPDGTILLQGLYASKGQKDCKPKWKDIPTVAITGHDWMVKDSKWTI